MECCCILFFICKDHDILYTRALFRIIVQVVNLIRHAPPGVASIVKSYPQWRKISFFLNRTSNISGDKSNYYTITPTTVKMCVLLCFCPPPLSSFTLLITDLYLKECTCMYVVDVVCLKPVFNNILVKMPFSTICQLLRGDKFECLREQEYYENDHKNQ